VLAALVFCGASLAVVVWPATRTFHLLMGGLAAFLLLVVLLTPRRWSREVGTSVFLLVVAVVLGTAWLVDDAAIRAGRVFEPFVVCKLGGLIVALLAPEDLLVSLPALAAFTVLPIVRTYTWPPSVRASLPMPEPWTTLFYLLVALVLLFHRRHQLATHSQMVRAQEQASAYERLMRKFLAVRDISNSPLQTIEHTLALLPTKCADASRELGRLRRSLDRLRELSSVLESYTPRGWKESYTSFDPFQVLKDVEETSR
jgi:hypothetical protein